MTAHHLLDVPTGDHPEPKGKPREWLLVSELFVSFQGEGPSTGERAMFIRLGACNLHCVWCDTPYTWVFDERHQAMHHASTRYNPMDELRRISIYELKDRILTSTCDLIVVTGGEPMLQAETLSLLISTVNEYPRAPRFEIETAGTIPVGPLGCYENVRFNVSPKLSHSGNSREERLVPAALKSLVAHSGTIFKFVVDYSAPDFEEIEDIVSIAGLSHSSVWLMPLGVKPMAIIQGMRELATPALARGWNLSTRMHVLIWNDERGH